MVRGLWLWPELVAVLVIDDCGATSRTSFVHKTKGARIEARIEIHIDEKSMIHKYVFDLKMDRP